MGCGHMADGVRAVLGDGSGFGVQALASSRSRARSAPAAR